MKKTLFQVKYKMELGIFLRNMKTFILLKTVYFILCYKVLTICIHCNFIYTFLQLIYSCGTASFIINQYSVEIYSEVYYWISQGLFIHHIYVIL